MSPERWQQVEEVYHSVLECTPARRDALLAEACDGDGELRKEVESLLAIQQQTDGFMAGAALSYEAQAIAEDPAVSAGLLDSLAGRQIGPYRLLEEIGHGGMGSVYRAERNDGQFQHQVAVKLLSFAGSAGLLVKFQDERQILANLSHPNIARLMDGGVTGSGVPYIVMECVDGIPADHYCRDRSIPERLRLFRAICSAVHYAHQHLVVHRDLKPANILVTADGIPKLLDFGIAKILAADAQTTGATMLPMMTPEYASPEQARGAPVSTTSDIYSLGVVLHEVLTGRRPYELTGKTYEEALRIICEQPLEKPGTGSADLDAIIGKAMRKEPAERYSSAEALSEDIGCYLEGRPVSARPVSIAYKARKFVVRHKLAVAASALAVSLIAAGFVSAVRQARIAERRFNDVRNLATSVIFDLHDRIAVLPGATEARKLLVTEALKYLDRLAQERDPGPQLLLELAAAYDRIGAAQGDPGIANLGDPAGALASYQKAVALLQAGLAKDPARSDARRSLPRLYLRISAVQTYMRKPADAVKSAEAAMSLWREALQAKPGDEQVRRGIAAAHFAIADALDADNRQLSIENRGKALAIFEELLAAHPESRDQQRNVALAHKTLGSSLIDVGDPGKALSHFLRARELDEKRVAANAIDSLAKLDLSFDLGLIGSYYRDQRNFPAALDYYRQMAAIRRTLVEADPKDTRAKGRLVYALLRVSQVFGRMGHNTLALESLHEPVALSAALVASAPGDPVSIALLAESYQQIWAVDANLAAQAPANSPKREAHTRAACQAARRSAESYRELEKRGALKGQELRLSKLVIQALDKCPAAQGRPL